MPAAPDRTDSKVTIRLWSPEDSLEAITELLHRAYAPLLEQGMRYLAAHQNNTTTEERLRSGTAFVAERSGAIVGTITVYGPAPTSACEVYRRPDTWHFGQFAVEPGLQGQGIGDGLLHAVETFARNAGAAWIGLDTSEHAHTLIDYYERRGYKQCGFVTWENVTNYRSVVLTKPLSRTAE